MLKPLAISILSLFILTGCVQGEGAQFIKKDADAAYESAKLRKDSSAKCWKEISKKTGFPETEVIGLLTAIQKSRNVRKFIEDEKIRAACAEVALDILLTSRKIIPLLP